MTAVADETLQIRDGTKVDVTRVSDVDDTTWAEVKAYVEGSVETAAALRQFAKDARAMRSWLQTQVIAEHLSTKLSSGDAKMQERMRSMEDDAELAPIVEDVRKNGLEAAMQHFYNEDLMLKFNQKMGGLPDELKMILMALEETPLTLHEAAKMGDLPAVKGFLKKKSPNAQDYKGITPLGYAVGSNHVAVVKELLDNEADPRKVDHLGNSGLHYAAGYGRTQLVEYFLKTGTPADLSNNQGQTALTMARLNKQEAAVQLLLRANSGP